MDNSKIYTELLEKIKLYIYNEDYNTQEKYFNILDKLIDAILFFRYNTYDKYESIYSNYQINNIFLGFFNNEKYANDNRLNVVFELIKNNLKIELGVDNDGYKDIAIYLFKIYKENNYTLPEEITTPIYNKLLNDKLNNYVSIEKRKIIKELKLKLPLTDKKRESLKRNLSLKRAKDLIKNNDYITLGISKEELEEKMKQLHSYLNTMKQFKKEKITIEQFQIFDNLFLNGNLNIETILTIYPDINKDNAKKILAKYDKILLPYLDNIDIELTIDNIDYSQVEFNYNHLKILDAASCNASLHEFINLFNNINEKIFILNNFDYFKDLFNLLPFINMFPNEFNGMILKSIILNYSKYKEILIKNKKISENSTFTDILNNFNDMLELAYYYNNVNIYSISILGKDVIKKIFRGNNTSTNPDDYIDTYKRMLSLSKSTIPPFSFEFDDYIIESGNNYDLNRLLIGKNCYDSCIGPKGIGESAYYEALTKKSADVIMITDKNNKFCARSLIFRRGNFIILAPFYGNRYLMDEFYTKDFLSNIANNILEVSKIYNDNLEYVFITDSYLELTDFFKYRSADLLTNIPHSDIAPYAYLIGSKEKITDVSDIKLKARDEVKVLYDKKRKNPIIKNYNYMDDVKRIKALQISMVDDIKQKEKLKNEFEQIQSIKYNKVYIGEDWYIGQKEDNLIDKCILPIDDYRQQNEINNALNMIADDLVNNSSIELLSFNKVKPR